MLRDTAVARIQQKLGFKTTQADEIITAIQDAQIKLELRDELPWFLRTEIASASTVVDEERLAVPTDFIREVEESALFIFDATATDPEDEWVALEKGESDTLRVDFPGTGTPQAYSLDGPYFRLFKTPDAVYTMKMVYYKQDTILTSNIENDWLKYIPFLLIGKAGMDFAQDLRDANALAFFTEMFIENDDLFSRHNIARRVANREYLIGGAD